MVLKNYYDSDGNPALQEISDDSGNVTAREYFAPGGEDGRPVTTRKEEYYERGTIRLVETHRPDGSVEKSTEYAKTGETTRETGFSENGTVNRMTEYLYRYDPNGLFVQDGRTDYLYSDEGKRKTVEKTDSDGDIVQRDEYNPDERVSVRYLFDRQNPERGRETHFSYDSDLNIVLEDERDGAGNRLSRRTYCSDGSPAVTEEYGENGRRVAKTVFDTENTAAIRREYDETGALTAEERFSTDGCLAVRGTDMLPDTGEPCFDYALMESVRRTEYDREGNAVSRTESGTPVYDTSGQSEAKMKTVFDTDGNIRDITVTERSRTTGETTVYRIDENGYTIGSVERYDRDGNPVEETERRDMDASAENNEEGTDTDDIMDEWESDWR